MPGFRMLRSTGHWYKLKYEVVHTLLYFLKMYY
jgi:hypothetical protein